MNFVDLIQRPEVQRDDQWETDFLAQFPAIKVQLEGETAKQGPDGWPYLFVRTANQKGESVAEVVKWAAEKGVGVVVNAHKMLPDYVFPYGMLWNFIETGKFMQPPMAAAGEVVYGEGV